MKPFGWCFRAFLNLELAIEFIRDDELVEVAPQAIPATDEDSQESALTCPKN